MRQLCIALAVWCFTTAAYAVEQQNGQYVWTFQSGEPWPSGYNQNTGKPDDLTWARNEYPADFFERIANALPEQRINEAFLTDDTGANIYLEEDAEVYVTFLHEGAGYKNSFGYFTFDPDNPPTDPSQVRETIVFPNLSYPHLTNGHRVSLGEFEAGTAIGFFIAANGFWYNTGVRPFAAPYYYSLQALNPDPAGLKQHNVLLYDEDVQEVILGFEDLPRSWGDNDFNDAVFSIGATPNTAIRPDDLPTLPEKDDSDADGVPDGEDEFPNDYDRATSTSHPSSSDYETWAFEDRWPWRGDHDLNDLVISERTRVISNADGDITGLRLEGFIEARGAAYRNGLGLRVRGIDPSLWGSATLTVGSQTFRKTLESGHNEIVSLLWRDSHAFTNTGAQGRCSHFNTAPGCPSFPPVPVTFDLTFSNVVPELTNEAVELFLFRRDYRGREVHPADIAPTARFDVTQLGKFDDTSNAVQGRYYRTESNLPWALRIPTRWDHPLEYIDVQWAYPEYEGWVESDGQENQSWYLNGRATHTFQR